VAIGLHIIAFVHAQLEFDDGIEGNLAHLQNKI